MTTATDIKLTLAEDAYAHLASFQRGDLVNIEGRTVCFPAVVLTPQQHAPRDINSAYLIVSNQGTTVRVSVGSLLAGRHTITPRA